MNEGCARRVDRRTELLAAAQVVFVRDGWSGATVKQIARHATVSEALIYRYFRSKEQLFEEAVLAPLERAGQAVVKFGWQMPAMSPAERRAAGQKINAQFLASIVEMTPLLHAALSRDRHSAATFYVARLKPLLDQIVEAGARVMAGWTDTDDAPLAALVMQGTYYWIGLDAMLGGTVVNPQAQGRRFADFLLRAVERTPAVSDSGSGQARAVNVVSDELWARLAPVLPDNRRADGRNHRELLEAVAWKYGTASAWRAVPARFGPWQTAWKRSRRWAQDGTWDRLLTEALREPVPPDDLLWLRRARDGGTGTRAGPEMMRET